MNITFGKSWFRAKKRLTEIWEEERARICHKERLFYVAVVGPSSSPSCYVEVNNDYIGVGFLDASLREYLCYQFQEIEPGQLFLTMATYREFEGISDTVRTGTSYYFNRSGSVTIESEDFLMHTRSVKETRADVTGNWEPYPPFGQYQSIVREDRSPH